MSKEPAEYITNPIAIRINSKELHEFVKSNGKKNKRSVSQEINFLIELGKKEVERWEAVIDSVDKGKSQYQGGVK
jgi:hypothetical protein